MVAIVGTPLGSIITKSRFCIFEDRAFVGAKLNVGARLLRGLQFYGIPSVGGASGTASWGEGGGGAPGRNGLLGSWWLRADAVETRGIVLF